MVKNENIKSKKKDKKREKKKGRKKRKRGPKGVQPEKAQKLIDFSHKNCQEKS